MNKHLFIVLACIVMVAAENATTTEAQTKHDHETKEAAKGIWAQLSPKEQECLKEKWQKNKEELKPAIKNCHDQKGGMTCVKEIPLVKECFA